MTIQHKDIPDSQRHEPKGASTASSGFVYVSNGAGSGTWKNPELSGQSAAIEGQIPVKTGASVSWQKFNVLDTCFCEVDSAESIKSLTQDVEISVDGAFFDDYIDDKFTLSGGTTLTVAETGFYIVHLSVQLKPQSSLGASNEIVEARLKINGTVTNPHRIIPVTITRNSAIDDVFIISGSRIIDFTAGDEITMTLKNLAATRSYKVAANFNMFRIG